MIHFDTCSCSDIRLNVVRFLRLPGGPDEGVRSGLQEDSSDVTGLCCIRTKDELEI